MQQILNAKALHSDRYGDIEVTCDGKMIHYRASNLGSRIFAADGKELVGDECGLTLSYWDDTELVVENIMA